MVFPPRNAGTYSRAGPSLSCPARAPPAAVITLPGAAVVMIWMPSWPARQRTQAQAAAGEAAEAHEPVPVEE